MVEGAQPCSRLQALIYASVARSLHDHRLCLVLKHVQRVLPRAPAWARECWQLRGERDDARGGGAGPARTVEVLLSGLW